MYTGANAPSSIPASSPNDSQTFSLLIFPLSRIPPRKEEFKKIPQQLQSHILERKRRPMEQLQHIRLVIQPP
jgi:hypothetical protein